MIRIIFHNGSMIDVKGIDKMYIEEGEMEKATIVGNIKELEEKDERSTDRDS